MQIFINELALRYPNDYILIITDSASNHVSKELIKPKNIKFLPLPAKSPQLNPIENLWHEIKEK
jgi:transposase